MKNLRSILIIAIISICLQGYSQPLLLSNSNGGSSELEISFPTTDRSQIFHYDGPVELGLIFDSNPREHILCSGCDFEIRYEWDCGNRILNERTEDLTADKAVTTEVDLPNDCVTHSGIDNNTSLKIPILHKFDKIEVTNPNNNDHVRLEYDALDRLVEESTHNSGTILRRVIEPGTGRIEYNAGGDFSILKDLAPSNPGPRLIFEDKGPDYSQDLLFEAPSSPTDVPCLIVQSIDNSGGPLVVPGDFRYRQTRLIFEEGTNEGRIALDPGGTRLLLEPDGTSSFTPLELNNLEVLVGGNLRVAADLNVIGTKNFRIDHPLQPGEMYLQHAAIESPLPMNRYDGIVETDETGNATVELPDYFTSVNRNYKYHLTVIGKEFSNVLIWEEIDKDGKFEIKSEKPHVKICWQVIAERNDDYIKKHPFQTELIK